MHKESIKAGRGWLNVMKIYTIETTDGTISKNFQDWTYSMKCDFELTQIILDVVYWEYRSWICTSSTQLYSSNSMKELLCVQLCYWRDPQVWVTFEKWLRCQSYGFIHEKSQPVYCYYSKVFSLAYTGSASCVEYWLPRRGTWAHFHDVINSTRRHWSEPKI